MTGKPAPSPHPTRPPPPPPRPIAATSFKKALSDLLILTNPATRVGHASYLANGITGLIHRNLEILSLSRSQEKAVAIDDLIHLGVIRSRLRSRNIPVARLDEIIEQDFYQILEEFEQSKTRRTVRQLDAILQAQECLVHDMGLNARDLDGLIEIIVQKMQEDAEEIITVSSPGLCELRIGFLIFFPGSTAEITVALRSTQVA